VFRKRVITIHLAVPGRLSVRLQPNHPTDDPRNLREHPRWLDARRAGRYARDGSGGEQDLLCSRSSTDCG
jgi:hypothetical protein